MFSIEQSAFLGALGRAIGHSLWQVAALWLLYTALTSIGKWSANRKYQFAASLGLFGFISFIAMVVFVYATLPANVQPTFYPESATITDTDNSVTYFFLLIYHSTLASLQSLAPYISCAYLLMFVLMSVRLYNGFRQVRLFATQGLQKADIDLRLFVQRHADALGIHRKVQIFTSAYVQGPLTLGFWKPIILLPVASLSNLTTSQVESILLHELAHIRRYDYLVNIFLQIAETTLFFNPFMRLLLKQAKLEREISCDEYVPQFQYSPKEYAKALLAIERSSHTTMLALAAKGNQSFQLLDRVKRMVAPEPKAFNYRQQLVMLLLFTILLVGFTVIIPHPKKAIDKSIANTVAKAATLAPQQQNFETTDIPTADNYTEAEQAPPPPPVFDVIKQITNYPKYNLHIDEQAIEAEAKKIELKAAEINALGEEMTQKLQPLTNRLEEWGKTFAAQASNQPFNTVALKEQLSKLPLEAISFIGQEYQQKFMAKVDRFVQQIIPNNQAIAKAIHINTTPQASVSYPVIDEDITITDPVVLDEEAIELANAFSVFDSVNLGHTPNQQWQQKRAMQGLRDAQEALRNLKNKNFQMLKKQISAAALNAQKLHLGLFTDDRDTTLLNAQKLLAQAQRRKNRNNISLNCEAPSAPSGNVIGRCTITLSDDDIHFSSDNENTNFRNSFQVDKQKVDVHHEKQVKNGKEEDVLVISISSLK